MRAIAGFPSPAADDLKDEIDPIAWLVRHPSATFWRRVSGDSLVGKGIHDGNLVAVDRAGKKRIGRIVLALVDSEIAVRKLANRSGNGQLARSEIKAERVRTDPGDGALKCGASWRVSSGDTSVRE